MGRIRRERWGSLRFDLNLHCWYGERLVEETGLRTPHRFWRLRAFAGAVAEIASFRRAPRLRAEQRDLCWLCGSL